MDINLFRHAPNQRLLEPGEVLFREGDAGEVMFAVLDGELQLTCSGRVMDNIGPGGIVGEMGLIDAAPRSATVTATVASTVAPVDKRRFTFLVQEHPTFALLVMQVMADRLRHANATVVHPTSSS